MKPAHAHYAPWCRPAHLVTDLFHHSYDLVSRNKGQPGKRNISLYGMKVRVAQAAYLYPQKNLCGSRLR